MSQEKNQNKEHTQEQEDKRSKSPSTLKGIATLFEREELKDLFIKYLILIGVIEGFIFFVSFISQLGPENVPFPWKSFFFAAFIVPLTITFLLGIIVLGFDRYLYGHHPEGSESERRHLSVAEQQSRIQKFHAVIYVIRQIPFLLGLLLLVILAAVGYKLDEILAVVGHIGEETVFYVSIALAVILGAALIMGLIWMFMSYNLRKKSMEYQYQYKKDVVEHTGMIIFDDERIMDKEGRILNDNRQRQLPPGDTDADDTLLIDNDERE
ncbi:MAG: hypothetical protein LC645_04040 [Geobacteraceae bacterium]|nr:hypothetical protein [Geobacteraceae bacterium]